MYPSNILQKLFPWFHPQKLLQCFLSLCRLNGPWNKSVLTAGIYYECLCNVVSCRDFFALPKINFMEQVWKVIILSKVCIFTCQYFGPGALNAFYKKIQFFPKFAPEWPKMTYFIVSWSDTVDIVCFFSKPLKMAHIKLKWNCLEGCFTMIATLRQWILQELSRKIS